MVIIDTAVNSDKKRKARITKTKEVIRQEVIQISSVTLTAEQISEIATAAVDYADAQEVDLALLLGLFRQESAFNPMAVSSAGAKGIGQVMDSTAEDIKSWKGRRYYNPFKISHNVEFSATYLSRMLILFDHDVEKALWAYNAGPKLVQLYLGGAVTKLPNETEKYAPAVMAFAKEFEALGLN
jgi:soluble lytic murein transglycosylase-like protein